MRTLGEEAKAILTGWRWSVEHSAYIKLVSYGERIQVEAVEAGSMPKFSAADAGCIEWWQSNDILRLIDRLELARLNHKPIHGYECWEADINGKTIGVAS